MLTTVLLNLSADYVVNPRSLRCCHASRDKFHSALSSNQMVGCNSNGSFTALEEGVVCLAHFPLQSECEIQSILARYLKQPYKDNYVDSSFLDSLIVNAHLQKYEPSPQLLAVMLNILASVCYQYGTLCLTSEPLYSRIVTAHAWEEIDMFRRQTGEHRGAASEHAPEAEQQNDVKIFGHVS